MAFGVGWLELVVLGLIAIMVFGPERLPRFIAQAAQWVRVIRAQANAARDDLMAAADIDPNLTSDLRQSLSDLAELNPKRMASSLLSDVADPLKDAAKGASRAAQAAAAPPEARRTVDGAADGAAAVRYDPDTT